MPHSYFFLLNFSGKYCFLGQPVFLYAKPLKEKRERLEKIWKKLKNFEEK